MKNCGEMLGLFPSGIYSKTGGAGFFEGVLGFFVFLKMGAFDFGDFQGFVFGGGDVQWLVVRWHEQLFMRKDKRDSCQKKNSFIKISINS